jgi:hypothetical protein
VTYTKLTNLISFHHQMSIKAIIINWCSASFQNTLCFVFLCIFLQMLAGSFHVTMTLCTKSECKFFTNYTIVCWINYQGQRKPSSHWQTLRLREKEDLTLHCSLDKVERHVIKIHKILLLPSIWKHNFPST